MERTVTLSGKELRLASSLFTIISYRQTFGSELFHDVEKLDKAFNNEKEDVSQFIDVLFRIVYILNKPYFQESYDHFLQRFDFSVLSATDELTALSNVIAELLGSVKANKEGPRSPR